MANNHRSPAQSSKSFLLSLGALAALVLSACGPEVVIPEGNWASVRDEAFIPSCACHTGDSPSAGLSLDGASADVVDVTTANHGGWTYIVPGEPDNSLVYVRLSGGDDDVSAMPPSSDGIDPDVAAAIRDWIEDGAPD